MTEINSHPNHTVLNHPILQHNLTILRNKNTSPTEFRRIMHQLSALMAYEITRDLQLHERTIHTPLQSCTGSQISDDVVAVSILRAGQGMLDGLLHMLPFSRVGHVGIYRDKFTGNTVEYYCRIPDEIENKSILLTDPLIGTGQTAVAAIERLKEYGVKKVHFIAILAAPEGLAHLAEHHPDTDVYMLSREHGLDENGYITPGIGDAGDRLYGASLT